MPVRAADTDAGTSELTEIVVTAQKRSESIQNVPYNISAVSAESLHDAGSLSMNNLTQLVPGLATVDQGPASRGNNNNFVLRGLRTDTPGGGAAGPLYHNLSASSISTYFGEVPVFFQAPLDDIERVEVLRGPQGTLYGSGAESGTIRFVPHRPEFGATYGEISGEGSHSDHSSHENGEIHGMLNLPLADNLALRVVAGETHIGGFIDATDRVQVGPGLVPVPSVPGNLASGFVLGPVQKGVNSSDQWFGRLALRWQPAPGTDIQFDYLHQHTSMADAQWGSDWAGGPFDSSTGVFPATSTLNTRPGCKFCTTNWIAEPYSSHVDLADLVASFDVGLGTVTSATSYYNSPYTATTDQTGIFYGNPATNSPVGSLVVPNYPYYGYPRLTSPTYTQSTDAAIVEELRLVSNPGKIFDYVAGLYFEHEHFSEHFDQDLWGQNAFLDYIGNPNPSPIPDLLYRRNEHTAFTDRALFGELTFHVTSQWQVTGGLRVFRQTSSFANGAEIPLCGTFCSTDLTDPYGRSLVTGSVTNTRAVWKFNTSYDFTPTLKVYATYSEGFRHGGSSNFPTVGPFASVPSLQNVTPDVSKNAELGVKGSLLGHRISYFADVYRMDTDNFQIDIANLGGAWGALNGSKSRSQGVELQVDASITSQFRAGLGYAYTDAYVLKSFNVIDYVPFALEPTLGGTGATASLFGGPIDAGSRMPGVSKNTANVMLEYSIPMGDWTWKLHADSSYRSSQNSTLVADSFFGFKIPAATLANASVTLGGKGPLTYQLFMRNITNNADITGGEADQRYPNPYRLRNVGMPRTTGLKVTYRF
jgi:iron complex outermembrane recepter protein